MRKIITTIGLCLLMMNTLVVAQEITPEVEQRARKIVSRMTLQEENRVYLRIYKFFPACNSPFGNT